jgi:hypothetical protein
MIVKKSLSSLLILAALLMTALPVRADERTASEYEVKAAFLFNFAKYTEWPAGSFADDRAPLTFCVLGDNPFGKGLESFRSKTVKNRPVAFREIADPHAAGACHVLFISASEQKRIDAHLASLRNLAVLTVSDTKKFAQSGGMIGFVTVDDKIRFEVNSRAANQAGLNISAQILKLARQIVE